jgi:undecaprenyl-diphosphatase
MDSGGTGTLTRLICDPQTVPCRIGAVRFGIGSDTYVFGPSNTRQVLRIHPGNLETIGASMSDFGIATILGIVLGLTEYLPVSSAGHLIVVASALNFTGPKATCFQVFIQIGAISAVLVLFRHRFVGLIPLKAPSAERFAGWRGLTSLCLTTLPAVILGAAFHHAIKTYLFNPIIVAGALGIGGVVILLAEAYKPAPEVLEIDSVNYMHAIKIGLIQCLALCPGVSRSASTILGGLFCGLDRRVAAEYSFLAAVPVLSAAAIYDLYKNLHLFQQSDLPFFATGLIVSFISASVAVRTFMALIQKWSLVPFGFYRIIVAPIIYLLLR